MIHHANMALTPGAQVGPYQIVSRGVTMLLFAGIAAYGFVISPGGQLTFKDDVLD